MTLCFVPGDLSDREGYDFEQIKSIAKVQVRTDYPHSFRCLSDFQRSLQPYYMPPALTWTIKPITSHENTTGETFVTNTLYLCIPYTDRERRCKMRSIVHYHRCGIVRWELEYTAYTFIGKAVSILKLIPAERRKFDVTVAQRNADSEVHDGIAEMTVTLG